MIASKSAWTKSESFSSESFFFANPIRWTFLLKHSVVSRYSLRFKI
jgi:hypothetical protein